MKGLFPEYDNSAALDYDAIWQDALFVFDTNVLLNLYRYRVGTRNELLALLEKIASRIWIPYHVALEFQRNRLTVIAEQAKRFSDVRQTVEKAKSSLNNELAKFKLHERHALINSEPLVSGFEKLTHEFFAQLETLEKGQQKINGKDRLKEQLERLFDGKVGANISKQEELQALHKEADARYKARIPPGFEDDDKDRKEPDEFMHSGLVFKQKYGDFIIWKQMLAHCMSTGQKSLIFITDDTKEDWWRTIELNGLKTIGPRAELIDEARREGKIENFLMYTPSSFLKFAKDALKVRVSEDAIEEVKELTLINVPNSKKQLIELAIRGRAALKQWLTEQYGLVSDSEVGITAYSGDQVITYIMAIAPPPRLLVEYFDKTEELARDVGWRSKELGRPVIVWIALDQKQAQSIKTGLIHRKNNSPDYCPLGIGVIIATLNSPDTHFPGFFVLHSFDL